MSEYNFENKTVIVTGASRGIGRGIAVELAKRKARVIAIARTETDLQTLKTEVDTIEIYTADIRNRSRIREILESVTPVHLLVNNAGIVVRKSVLEMTMDELDSSMDTNFKAAVNLSQIVAQQMVTHGISGSIVNISSVVALRAFNHRSAYCCSKAALDMFTKTFALELGPKKIRMNSVNPTLILTELGKSAFNDEESKNRYLTTIPAGRFGEVQDVVDAVLFLLSDKSSMINGACVVVDGGQTIRCT